MASQLFCSFCFYALSILLDLYAAIVRLINRVLGRNVVVFPLQVDDILQEVKSLTNRKAPLQHTKEWMDLLQGLAGGLNASEFITPSFRFLVMRKLLVQLLVETVEANDAIRCNPGALSISITRPVFIVGPGCTNSALLHRLLCMFPDVHYVTSKKLRSVSSELSSNNKDQSGSELSRPVKVHEWPKHVEVAMTTARCQNKSDYDNEEPTDCAEIVTKYLFLRVYGSYLYDYQCAFKHYITCKEFVNYAYEMYKQDLQLMFYLNKEFNPADSSSSARFLFRSSTHCLFLDAISSVFQDAVIVQLHRHPVDTVESLLNESTLRVGTPALKKFAKNVLDRLDVVYQQMIQRSKKWTENEGSGRRVQVIDIKSQDMEKDPIGVAANIAVSLGWEKNEEIDAKVQEELLKIKGERQEVKVGVYRGLSDFSMTANDICDRFKIYCDYYNL